jgi:8-oxo-dGTP diphosphatase
MTRNIAVTLECFIKKGDKYLMLHRHSDKKIMPGVWMAPGGHREFNEGLFEAARREVKEETGLKIKNLKLKAVGNAYLKDLDKEFYFYMVTADYDSGDLKQKVDDGEFVWMEKNEILKLDRLLAELKTVLPHILSDSVGVISYKAVYDKGNDMTFFELESSS